MQAEKTCRAPKVTTDVTLDYWEYGVSQVVYIVWYVTPFWVILCLPPRYLAGLTS